MLHRHDLGRAKSRTEEEEEEEEDAQDTHEGGQSSCTSLVTFSKTNI